MVETSKQVRVDNWGIYFLQRLQLFFSKTDFCDLTLQFEGNVQLKVHRLVMNACTEYFAFLEQTCPALEENTIIMPADLQADVIVPIVNFMYTGMLEFHPSIYDKLYRAAEIMNIAVLTKLLEAQLAPVNRMTNWKREREKELLSRKEIKKPMKPSLPVANDLPAPQPVKKVTPWKKRVSSLQSQPVTSSFATSNWISDPVEKDQLSFVDNTPKPTRFEWPEDDLSPMPAIYQAFDEVSLTSKPLWTKEDEQKAAPIEEHPKAVYPGRRSNSECDDVFHEKEQKVPVSQMDHSPLENSSKRKADAKTISSPKRVKITNQDDETVISITTSNPNDVDHTKIVSEILKKYPDLVKKNKNLKLKITQAKPDQSPPKVQTVQEKQKLVQPPSPVERAQPLPTKDFKNESILVKETPSVREALPIKKNPKKANFRAASEEGPWTCMDCFGNDLEVAEFVLYYLFRKHMADQHNMEFDSSLCKYCGKKCPKENLMIYHLYTKHGLKPPRNIDFPKCNCCPFIAVSNERLQEHLKTHTKFDVQCKSCMLGFTSKDDLLAHQQMVSHGTRASSILDCAYCMKKLQSPVTLFTHVRAQHMKQALRDGISSLKEAMDIENEDIEAEVEVKEEEAVPYQEKIVDTQIDKVKERVKIISNVKVARSEENVTENVNKAPDSVTLQPQAEAVAVTTTAAALSNISGSLATNLGLVDIVVLDDNQQYILQQPQGQTGNAEFILPHELAESEGILQAAAASGDLNSTDELVMVLTDHDYQDEQNQGQTDNSNIVVLYSHPVEGQQGQYITSQGNLLVNSEGMLEIRNGAAITTTAGQILMNSNSTTTTQAQESPTESIDLIRKEIEATSDNVDRESIKTVLRNKVLSKKIDKIEKEKLQPPVQMQQNHAENNVDAFDGANKEVIETVDETDSSIREEPMEVDEIESRRKEHLDEVSGQLEILEPEVDHPVTEYKPLQPIEETNEGPFSEHEAAGISGEDVPPTVDRNSEMVPQSAQEGAPLDKILMNDPEYFQNNVDEPVSQEEPMEVDGGKMNEPLENISAGVDEVDNQVQENTDVLPSVEDQTHKESPQPKESNEEEFHHNEENHMEKVVNNISQEEQTHPEESSEANENSSLAPVQEQLCSMEIKEGCMESYHEKPDEGQNQDETEQQREENEGNDSNDNVQPNYDDFTDESQQSSSQKSRKDLNKEILDDWDDTDSQQSQNQEQEQEGQESEQDQSALNAAENVTKLMDDWDEEDEDQTKE